MSAVCIETPGEELPDCDVAWSGHDGQFLRAVAHVEHRAKLLLGFPVEAYSFAGLHIAYRPAAAYRQAIADEPARTGRQSRLPSSGRPRRRNPSSTYGKPTCEHGGMRHEPLTKSQALAMEQGQTLFSK